MSRFSLLLAITLGILLISLVAASSQASFIVSQNRPTGIYPVAFGNTVAAEVTKFLIEHIFTPVMVSNE